MKLVFIIMTTTYFLGMLWQFITIEMHHIFEEETELLDPKVHNTEDFITSNDMDPSSSKRTDVHNMALLMYFAYTTLSTVGFGDFNPRSDFERLICIIILLLGVGIFALIMGNFLDIIDRFKMLDEVIEDGEQLNRFFDTIKKRYNHGFDMNIESKRHIEMFFENKWQNDKN